ncbi:peptidoglycan recognition protein family protein, partial [Streptomyces olivaceoviridis]
MSKIMHMRGFLTSCPGVSPLAACSIGLTFATALALAPAAPATAAAAPVSAAPAPVSAAPAPVSAAPAPVSVATAATAATAVTTATGRGQAAVPGSTRSLPLVPLSRERVLGGAPEQGLYRTGLDRFALVGVVWDDPGTELRGQVRVRTRSAVTGQWSGWQDVEAHHADHGADPDTEEGSSRRVRGATAPLWVGDCDGVDVRVRAAGPGGGDGTGLPSGKRAGGPGTSLPPGLRLELVDPGGGQDRMTGEGLPANPRGDDPPRTALDTEAAMAASAANADITAFGATAIPERDRSATEQELTRLQGPVRGKPYIGPRPRIVTRRGWGADESLRERGFVHTKKIKAAFVHHTATGNAYTCAQAPSVIRGIYRYHVKSMGWRDIGYNFLVDKCGTLYEGRAGGVAKAVLGAHTLGFNTNSMGIAVIGTYGAAKPSSAAVKA